MKRDTDEGHSGADGLGVAFAPSWKGAKAVQPQDMMMDGGMMGGGIAMTIIVILLVIFLVLGLLAFVKYLRKK